jgi:WD40-like Beta Propeller Repeat
MRRIIVAVSAAVLALSAAPAALAGPAGSTELLTAPTGLGESPGTANDSATWYTRTTSNDFAVNNPGRQLASTNGRYVVFTSRADGMAPDDNDGVENVYVRDTVANTTTLVSRADGPTGAAANHDSFEPAISADGSTVAFMSLATNLAGVIDTAGTEQIYARNIVDGTTTLVSRADGSAGVVSNNGSEEPSISDDGRVIAFSSFASNLGGGSGHRQVYVRIDDFETKLVSNVTGTTNPGGDDSEGASVSGDGNWVAFSSAAALDPDDTNSFEDVFERHLSTNTDRLVSRATTAAGPVGNSDSSGASVDDDGGVVAFTSNATNLFSAIDTSNDDDIYVRDFGASTTSIASVTGITKGNSSSFDASISADGTKVAFTTPSTNLAAIDTNGVQDVYVHTLSPSESTVLASRCVGNTLLDQSAFEGAIIPNGTRVDFATASDGCSPDDDNDYSQAYQRTLLPSLVEPTVLTSRPTGTAPLQSNTNDSAIHGFFRSDDSPSTISADGRFTAFASEANDLSPDDDNTLTNVFVRDAQTDTTTLVSRASGATGAGANGMSGPIFGLFGIPLLGIATSPPAISADGHIVAFTSAATNLVPGDANGHSDVFVRNLLTDTTTLVSVKTDGSQVNQDSFDPAVSADGNRIAFASRGQLDPADSDSKIDIYVRDIAAGTTTLVSRANGPAGAIANDDSTEPAISGDGNRVAFVTGADNLIAPGLDTNATNDVYVRDIGLSATVLASARSLSSIAGNLSSSGPSLDSDGGVVAFSSNASNITAGDANGTTDVYTRALLSGVTTLVSREPAVAVAGNDFSDRPSISADGTRIAFETDATDLFSPDTDQAQDIVLRDQIAGTTTLVARADGASGAEPDAQTGNPSLSANGHCLAFDSDADNLVAGQPPGTDFTHAFLRAIDADCAVAPVVPIVQPISSPPAPDKTKPVISKLKLSHTKFKVGKTKTAVSAVAAKAKTKHHKPTPSSTTLSYTLSENASMSIVVEHKLSGRKRSGKCVTGKSAPKHGTRCTKYTSVKTLKRTGKKGSNKVSFTGRISSTKLSAGSYRFAITATDAAKNKSSTHHISFTVVSH